MTAINRNIPLFDGFVKIAVGLVAFVYLFGIFWYPSLKYAVMDIVFILGLCFRFSFVINNELPKWKIFTSLFFYTIVILDQAFDVVLANGSLDKVLTSSSVILILPLISAFFLDLWQFKRTHSVE
ncbi:hypothetical protein MNBD_GAMMA15-1338 [hydrothermal vent metagenome]|uniref:Uncharacterized protein n=1 Tax=hydrothermal vent metagenome TaxID=652676 RepID=A0A3B0Y120_9ZZZZ